MFILFLTFLLKKGVLEYGMFWATGSMNYLWPTACLCIALIPFSRLLIGENVRIRWWWMASPALVYGSFQEQTSLVLVCFSLVALASYRVTQKKYSVPGVMLAVLAIVGLLLLFLAPGNFVRMEAETVRHYPDFNLMPLLQKAYNGANYTLLNHWFYDSVKPFLTIVILTCYFGFKKSTSHVVKAASLIPLCYILICMLFTRVLGGEFAQLLNLDIYDATNGELGKQIIELNFLPVFIGCLVLLLIPGVWVCTFERTETLTKLLLFYCAGIFSSFILSFCPTIFASGYRVFFVPDIMMIIVALLLFTESLDYLDLKNKIFVGSYCLLAISGCSKIIRLVG